MSSGVRGVLWLLIVLAILALGWGRPLRYLFMSEGQIAASQRQEEEANATPAPPPPTPWQPLNTTLEHREKGH